MNQTVVDFERAEPVVEARWHTAVVQSSDSEYYELRLPGEQSADARRAFSCLMEPLVGDTVCVLADEQGQLHITAVLTREAADGESTAAATLRFDGKLQIAAGDGLALQTDKDMQVSAEKLQGTVSEVNWFSKVVGLTSNKLQVFTRLARLTSKTRELLTGKNHVFADHSLRQTTHTDQVRSAIVDVQAKTVASIQAPSTLIKAKKLAKVDSSQIHIG